MPSHAAGLAKTGKTVKGPKGTQSNVAIGKGKIKGRSGMANTKVKK